MPMSFYPSLLHWPDLLNRDRMFKWELGARTISGGRSVSGVQQVGRTDGGGVWMATMDDVQVSTPNQIRAWKAIKARLDGGATPIVMPCREVVTAPWPLVGGVALTDLPSTNSDDSTLSDDTEYEGSPIQATLAAGADLRATQLLMTFATGGPLLAGETFSIQHQTFSWRRYEVAGVTLDGDGNSLVTIRPPLREATPAGQWVEFNTPKCVMQLASPDAMDLPLELRTYGKASPKFVESFPPWE